MYEQVQAEIAGTDIFIGCAAVSDYRPRQPSRQKIKRSAPELELALGEGTKPLLARRLVDLVAHRYRTAGTSAPPRPSSARTGQA
jgi:phosphopantothenoylcysteine synthetase/decarboxylase